MCMAETHRSIGAVPRCVLIVFVTICANGTARLNADLIVASVFNSRLLRFDAETGQFIETFVQDGAGGLDHPGRIVIGPGGDLYVTSGVPGMSPPAVLQFDGQTGEFVRSLVLDSNNTQLRSAISLVFGPDGSLYVGDGNNSRINRYDGTTGAFISRFIADDPSTPDAEEAGGMDFPWEMQFGADGGLYVVDSQLGLGQRGTVLRFDGETGQFLGDFLSQDRGRWGAPMCMAFRDDGFLYVGTGYQSGNEPGQSIKRFIA